MRIGIDISILANQFDGIGFYLLEVLKELEKDKCNIYYLYSAKPTTLDINENNFIIRDSNSINHIQWLLKDLRKQIRNDKIDVFWQPNYIMPFKVEGVKNIITVHDLSGLNPRYVDYKTVIKQKFFLALSCKYADLILTDSNFSKDQIINKFHPPLGKVQTIYLSLVGRDRIQFDEYKITKSVLNLRNINYFLFVGTLAPRKNDTVLLKAYEYYYKNGGRNKLVLAGKCSKHSLGVLNKIDKIASQNIIQLGYISEDTKNFLYHYCSCVLYPSRLEGFGIPILEAMAHRKMVVTSRISSIPEVAKDAAIYIDNINDYKELGRTILSVDTMPYNEKEILIQKGMKQVEHFEQLKFAEKTANALYTISNQSVKENK